MNTLTSERVSLQLDKLHRDADEADRGLVAETMARMKGSGETIQQMAARLVAKEQDDVQSTYRAHAGHFLAISPAYGRFLYGMARVRGATRIVEFGTSMGISTIYLAAAIRDNGGGHLIGTELEPTKVARARANVEAAGLADLVEIREGDALETLQDVPDGVDLVLIDGAWSLYLPVLMLIEPRLVSGAAILGENALTPEYLAYVRDQRNGYLSQPLAVDEGRGNEFTVRIG